MYPQRERISFLKTHPHFNYTLSPLFNTIHPIAHARNGGTLLGTFLSLNLTYNPLLSPVHPTPYLHLTAVCFSKSPLPSPKIKPPASPRNFLTGLPHFLYPFPIYFLLNSQRIELKLIPEYSTPLLITLNILYASYEDQIS